MAEVFDQTSQVIAKELAMAVIEKVYRPDDASPEKTGDHYGKLYKQILKNVREAFKGEYD